MSLFEAIRILRPDAVITVHNNTLVNYYHPSLAQPSEAEIQAKVEELERQAPVEALRKIRNGRLNVLDKYALFDYTFDTSYRNQVLQLRQRLRDMPATTSASLNEFGVVTGVDFPRVEDMPTTSIFIKNISESYAVPIDSHDKYIFCDTSGEGSDAIEVTLPKASDVDGREFFIKDLGGNAGTRAISVVGVDNAASSTTTPVASITSSSACVHVVANAGAWITM